MGDVADPIQVRGAVIPADELSWRFSRSSGPGGQSVNTSDSRVELSYDLASSNALGPVLKERALRTLHGRLVDGVLTVSASEFRSQLRNREAAARRLADVLTAATAPPPKARRADQAHPRVAGAAAGRQAAPLQHQAPAPLHRRVASSLFAGEAFPGGLAGHVQRRTDLGPRRAERPGLAHPVRQVRLGLLACRRHPGQRGQDLVQRRLLLPWRHPRRAVRGSAGSAAGGPDG